MNQCAFGREPIGIARRAERGVVMWVALVVLIVMTLAGLAMLRQMGGGLSIAGNLTFKQNATSAADLGTEAFRTWLVLPTTAALLNSDVVANGYFSSWGTTVDPKAFDWNNQSVLVQANTAANSLGNEVRYIAQRLCATAGMSATDPAQKCSDVVNENSGTTKGVIDYVSGAPITTDPAPFYRVTTRVLGPRNTVTYTQVIMN